MASERTPPSSPVPDAVLMIAGLGLLVLGPLLLLQDVARIQEAQEAASVVGERVVPRGSDLREALQSGAFLLLGIANVAGAWRLLSVRRTPKLRRWTQRPARLLLVGLALADLAWWIDGRLPDDARAYRVIDPVYAVAGFLILGAAYRILTLVRPRPPGDPDAYGL